MTEMFRRRIRVEGQPEDIKGYSLTARDTETHEQLLYIAEIDLHLSARSLSTATLTYYDVDVQGKLLIKDGEPVIKTATTNNPEVSLTALETMPLIEQLQEEVRMYREARIKAIEERRKRAENQGELRVLVDKALYAANEVTSPNELEGHRTMVQIAQGLLRDIYPYIDIVPS